MTGTIQKIMRQKDRVFYRESVAPLGPIEDLNYGDTVQFQSPSGDKWPVACDLNMR